MNLENQSSKSGERKTEELEKQVENLKKIIAVSYTHLRAHET